MSKLDDVIETYPGHVFDNYPDQWKKQAAVELAALRAERDEWKKLYDWAMDELRKRVEVLPFTEPSAVEPSEEEVRG